MTAQNGYVISKRVLTKHDAVAVYRKATAGDQISRYASNYMKVINWHMLLYVCVSLHEEVCLFFQISDVEVKALKKFKKFIFQL